MSKKCPHCGNSIEVVEFKAHVRACFFEKKGESMLVNKDSDLDWIVQQRELKEEIDYRMNLFRADRGLDGSIFIKEDLSFLTASQFHAIEKVRKIAIKMSLTYQNEILERLDNLGVNGSDQLKKIVNYIRDEAPLIIHFRPQLISSFIKTGRYMSMFELGRGTGWRKDKENILFEYPHNINNQERCKYGVLNILKDPHGVKSCYGYGDCYMVLRNVRMRTTFSNHNTTGTNSDKMGTCENYLHVLNTYNDSELQAISKSASGKKSWVDSNKLGTYKEVQYHGDILFKRDIQCLVINDRWSGNREIKSHMKQFSKKYNVDVFFMKDYSEFMDLIDSYQQLS